MSINLFFIVIFALLVGMFEYFQPHDISNKDMKEVPQFELNNFIIYEISPLKINRYFEGKHGLHYSDRYVIKEGKFTNNERALLESIRADNALYKGDLVTLNGGVHYVRSDGVNFYSEEGQYDQKNGLIKTDRAFKITKEGNSISGIHLDYNLNLDTVSADRIQGVYQLK
ncbi:MAG: LPS export ABC transporter periplasmic protein LptC [Sulfuricurvum sp.]|jgi:LPS export ABC transporter protein LptC|uniref:LPS export ABC transporter periplasmic protein LptC n=1 Tax=Sulfuricurvum sp. TaxID=2025608 RepID=UPI00261AFDF6|nr:LPS export ABC transporter periplasmic protein LptC [Sulfuricurvum sp.]MDD2829509.1 LPS export ABC transporter periplasmic protein LptC [Sulfuricurvum sp.]MDD4949494.1 LPS export ABC transporter periplasmic protein LptC [Sulfuricurvum sp.]